MREIVSACARCLVLRTDPPERFCWPDGSPPDGSLCSWYGDCGHCGRPTKWLMLGTRVVAVAPKGGDE